MTALLDFFSILMRETEEIRRDFASLPKVLTIQSIGMSPDKYRRFIKQLYHIVWHFCPIMSHASARIGDESRSLRLALWHEIAEEQGHDEWVLGDYVAAGGDADELRGSEPAIPVQALIGYNYSVADRTPLGVFGMRFAQEMIAKDFAGDAVDAISAATGLAPDENSGFRFLLSHSTMDAAHIEELSIVLRAVSNEKDQAAIIRCAKVNYHLFAELVED